MFKTPQELRALLVLAKFARTVQRGLSWIGVKTDAKMIEDMVTNGESLLELAASFNPTFVSRGWIAHNALNVTAAREALAAARVGNWEQADNLLADAHDSSVVRMYINHLSGLRCFRDRRELALLALADYEAGRYHACVPVILALLDGMGQQLTGAGLFRQGAKIDAKDSFLELGPGLAGLLKAMSPSRKRTTVAPISVPFRHGILHGTDLGYANRIVAAKAWGALLATGYYAKSIENPTSEEPRPGLLEALRGYAENRRRLDHMQQFVDTWRERTADELAIVIRDQNALPGTPEAAVVDVVKAWQTGNFGLIARLSMDAAKTDTHHFAGQVRKNLGRPPTAFRITGIEENASAAGWVQVSLQWDDNPPEEVRLRLICMLNGDFAPRGMPGSTWMINSLWPLESVRWLATRSTEADS